MNIDEGRRSIAAGKERGDELMKVNLFNLFSRAHLGSPVDKNSYFLKCVQS